MTDTKPKIIFAPGAFDSFDGTQEELDELIAEVNSMFEGKTAEEISFMSRPLSEEDFDELPDDVKLQLSQALDEIEPDAPEQVNRKLQ
jgi:hypothetical protein